VCVHEDALLCVRLRDPASGVTRLFVPGGAIAQGESPAAAAERETLEETGYSVHAEPASELVVHYPFVWNGERIECTTHFFRARLCSDRHAPAATHDDAINLGAVWLPLAALDAELGFHAAILRAVRSLIPA